MERSPPLRLDLSAESSRGPRDPWSGRGRRHAVGAQIPGAAFPGRNAAPAAAHALGADAEDAGEEEAHDELETYGLADRVLGDAPQHVS
eukprot:3200840-Pyramimonas_sp.AAC.1